MYGRSNQLEELCKSLISSSSHSPWVKCCLSMEMFKERLDLEGHRREELRGLGPCGVTELSGRLYLVRQPGRMLDFAVFVWRE